MILQLRTVIVTLGAAALIGAAPAPPSGTPVVINASIPQTGPGAFLGKSLVDAFRAVEIVVNGEGGIRGRPLKIVTADSQTSPAVNLQIVQGYIAKQIPLYLDGGPSPVCNAALPIVSKSGPVDYCLSPAINTVPFGYVFAASAPSPDVQRVAVRYFRLRGWKRLAMLSSTDASGVALEAQAVAALALPENRDVQLVAQERFAPTDVSAAAQITRIEASKPDAIFVWATGTPVATAFRALNDAGNTLPVQVPSSNMVYSQLQSYAAFLPKQLFFATLLALTPEAVRPGPVHDAQMAYQRAFKAIGVRPDAATNLAWDPLMIFVDALRHLGPDPSADQVRTYITHLHGWVGANGVFDFGAGDQHGIGENAVDIAQWNAAAGKWQSVSRPHGYPLGTGGH
jgi:branched-chain amino acid transport system substrate-binding protein